MTSEEDIDGWNGLYQAINSRGEGVYKNQCSSPVDQRGFSFSFSFCF